MMDFSDIGSFAKHMGLMAASVQHELDKGLKVVADRVEKTAKAEVGHYLEAIGPFPAWDQLADSTQADRIAKGYSANDPGLRDGMMKESITNHVQPGEAVIGSDDQNLVYFELGTTKQPPRPVLGPAVVQNHDLILRVLGGALVKGVVGGEAIAGHLGYDRDL